MDWMDTVFLAKFDPLESSIIDLIPYKSEKHFFEDELIEIEKSLEEQLIKALNKQTIDV